VHAAPDISSEFQKMLSHNPQDSAVYLKQFNFYQKEIITQNLTFREVHCDRKRIPSSTRVHFFGTGKMLPGRADLNEAMTGPY
jgi:hypothetical protein